MNTPYLYFCTRGIVDKITLKLGKTLVHNASYEWRLTLMNAMQESCRNQNIVEIDYNKWTHGWLMYLDMSNVKDTSYGFVLMFFSKFTDVEGEYKFEWKIESKKIKLKSWKLD